jgi:hypothetical protein
MTELRGRSRHRVCIVREPYPAAPPLIESPRYTIDVFDEHENRVEVPGRVAELVVVRAATSSTGDADVPRRR